MVSRSLVFKLCLLFHVLEVVTGISLAILSFLLQNAANVNLAATPSWAGIPFAILGLVGIIVIVLNKHKEELVFVLVFHGLIIVLCFIGLILVAPKVKRWKDVDKYQKNGGCKQQSSFCNCTQALPKKVYKCTDLGSIFTLAVTIVLFTGLCFVAACITAYLDFYIIKTYVAKDEPLTNSSSSRKDQSDSELVDNQYDGNQYEVIGHIGPLSTPDLLPKFGNEVSPRVDSLEWSRSNKPTAQKNVQVNKDERYESAMYLKPDEDEPSVDGSSVDGISVDGSSVDGSSENADVVNVDEVEDFDYEDLLSEAELQWQETPRIGRNSIGSAASLPMGNGVTGARSRSLANRERAFSMPNSVAGSRQSIKSRKDHLLKRLQSVQSREDQQPPSEDENENEEIILNAIQHSSRSSLRRDLQGAAAATTPTRSLLLRDSPHMNQVTDAEAIGGEFPGKFPESPRYSPRESPRNTRENGDVLDEKESPRNSLVGNGGADVSSEKDENTTRESRPKTGVARNNRRRTSNDETYGLPPLPLKGSSSGLSVKERTFSAPALPFINPAQEVSSGMSLGQRPGSSGSQVVARSKREHTTQTRNELIDKEMMENLGEDRFVETEDRGRFGNARNSVSDDGSSGPMRKTSYETDSTDVGIIDDKTVSSDSVEDPNKKPRWHPPWQLKQEIVAHRDSVPVIAIEPKNRWFASGSSDRSMKIWDINTGACRLTVRDHKAGIRALAFGITGHRFLFSAGDDRQLLCTDIEVNRVIHKYPDQSSVIYAMTMYAPSELLVTCGRDKHVRIWDTREQKCVKTMRGHINTVSSLAILENSRQIISGSHDSTMRIWDIGEGRCTQILMGHDKSVRSIVVHPGEPIVSSASTERIIHWSMPEAVKKQEITPSDISINCISVNPQGALVAAGSNGVIHLWDWRTGHKFQKIHRTKVYESQEVPICVFCAAFDKSGSRLIVSDASNVIKVYREAYTRVRRRNNLADGADSKKFGKMFSKIPTPDYAFM